MTTMTDRLTVASRRSPQTAVPIKTKKLRRRGRVTMWLAIVWLAFITISAIGANWLPYIKHSCDQYAVATQCSTHVKGSLLKIEKPPAWAWFAEPEKQIGNGPRARRHDSAPTATASTCSRDRCSAPATRC